MNIAVLGTGVVAKTLAGKLAELGHRVQLGTRDVTTTLARTEPDMLGGPSLRTWLDAHPQVSLGTFADAVAHGEIVINALAGAGAIAGLQVVGELAGKVLVDVSNPLDFSQGFPPSLTVSNTDSLGEQLQRAFPAARVVKTLNTVAASVMIEPGQLAGGQHTMFVCGNDAEAKQQVTSLLGSFGWRDIVDLGDITNARGTEMWLPLWVRLYRALGTPAFNLKLVR